MPKIKNATGEDRILPWLHDRLVLAGQVVEVNADDVYAYTCQVGWEPADDEAKGLTDAAAKVDEEVAAVISGEVGEPAGNASRDEWVAYVTGTSKATPNELDGLSRDEIRDTYKEN